MSAEINYKGNLKIEEYEFGAFLQAFQDAVLNGYVLDLESNEHYPQRWGTSMEVTLVSTNFQPVEEIPEVTTEVEEKVQEVDTSEEKISEVEEIPEVVPELSTSVPTEGTAEETPEVKPEEVQVVAKRGRKSSS